MEHLSIQQYGVVKRQLTAAAVACESRENGGAKRPDQWVLVKKMPAASGRELAELARHRYPAAWAAVQRN